MRSMVFSLGFALCLGMVGCKSENTGTPAANTNTAVLEPGETLSESAPIQEPPVNQSPDSPVPPLDPAAIATTSRGLNAFTLALYKETPKKGNTVLSPFSVAAALSLVELGAKTDSAAALHKVFGADSAEQHRKGLQGLVHMLKGGGGPVEVERYGEPIHPHTLRVGNSLWVAEGYKLDPSFVDAAQTYYEAIVDVIQVSAPEASADKVNAWVREATADKIKDIVQPQSINKLTRMILVNAVHFLGRWHEPFREQNTADRPFHANGKKETVAVPTMLTGHYFQSLDNDEVTIAEMPYWSTSEDTEIAMTLIVPKKRDGLEALEAKLSPALLGGWISSLQAQETVTIYLPKWKAETAEELSEPLGEIGLKSLFGPGADLSGISSEEGLQISGVLHKTFISVDEKGTEAAAATAIMMVGGAPAKPIELHADHPFLYLIRDTKSGAILFIGRVVDPRL
jgi:serpin B